MVDVPRSITPVPVSGSRVRVAFGAGNLAQLGTIAKNLGGQRVLLVSDAGIVKAGHVERAVRSLYRAGLAVRVYDEVEENPTTGHVAAGLKIAKEAKPDLIVGLGGGSSMDCAKGINFLLTNGGKMQDYWGVNKAAEPLLSMIAIPTTAGTGSDAQSFALITDPQTHQKMACGDSSALPRVAILDPELTRTQPHGVAAATGIDAIAHAVETAGSNKRTDVSRSLSGAAWKLLEPAYGPALAHPASDAGERMLLGAHIAGAAIENSMLGAAHSCANALTALCGTVHGVAVGLMLPHVVRYNCAEGTNFYADLMSDAESLAKRLTSLLEAGGLPRTLKEVNAAPAMVPELAALAAKQWTASFNPRAVGTSEFRSIFEAAL